MRTATSIEQSRKLLPLGIDPETADMYYCGYNHVYRNHLLMVGKAYKRDNWEKDLLLAWSLSGLIALIPKRIVYTSFRIFAEDDEWYVGFAEKTKLTVESPDLFTACIDLIEQLIEQGYIKTKKA